MAGGNQYIDQTYPVSNIILFQPFSFVPPEYAMPLGLLDISTIKMPLVTTQLIIKLFSRRRQLCDGHCICMRFLRIKRRWNENISPHVVAWKGPDRGGVLQFPSKQTKLHLTLAPYCWKAFHKTRSLQKQYDFSQHFRRRERNYPFHGIGFTFLRARLQQLLDLFNLNPLQWFQRGGSSILVAPRIKNT